MDKLLRNYCGFVVKKPLLFFLPILLATVLMSVWLLTATPLKLDTDFNTLLPGDIPCVLEAERISKQMGSTDYLIVAVESPVPEDNRAFIDAIVPKISALPEVTWASVGEDKSFFRDHFALYLDTADLEEIVRRAKARVDYEREGVNPFLVNIEEEEPPDISMQDILDKYRMMLARQGIRGVLAETDAHPVEKGPQGKTVSRDYFSTPDGRIFSLMARTTKSSTDLEFGRNLVKKVNEIILASDPHRNNEMVAEVVGSFRNRSREFNNIIADIFSSLALSFGLILFLIIIYFRRLRAIFLVTLPLVAGIIWTASLTAVTLGRLNMVTALIFAVLLGLGIDFGVHMTMRYLEERGRGAGLEESLYLAVSRTGRAIVTSGLTTAAAMVVLMFSKFKGFSEFGFIAATGIVLCLLAYLLILPSFSVLVERLSKPLAWRFRSERLDKKIWPAHIEVWKQLVLLAVVVSVTTLSIWSLPRLSFEYNFRNLKGKNVSTNIHYGRSIGGGTSPVVALLPTPEEARLLTRSLEKIVKQETESPVPLRRVFSLYSFVPEDQQEKRALLETLQDYIDEGLRLDSIDGSSRDRLEKIRNWTEAQPFGVQDLPEWVLSKFREKDGTLGRMVYLDSGRDDYRVDQIAEFYDHYGAIELPGGGVVHPSSTGFILVEVIRAVQDDGLAMTLGAVVVVLLILLVDLRSVRRTLVVFLPLFVGLIWTAGIMAAYNIRIGLYNMLVLPALLGVGIDASVHLYHALREKGQRELFQVLRMNGGAVLIAGLTTGAGFVGLTIVSHLGLRSIGILAVIGIVACLAGTLLTMPLVVMLKATWQKRRIDKR